MKVLLIALAVGFPLRSSSPGLLRLLRKESSAPKSRIQRVDNKEHWSQASRNNYCSCCDCSELARLSTVSQQRPASLPNSSVTQASIERATISVPISEKSIAVLPFENLSSDKENAYFADGIQDEILTRLAGISDLKSSPDFDREVQE